MNRLLAALALVLSGLVVTAQPAAAHGQCEGPSDIPILVEYGSLAGAPTTVCAQGAAGMRALDALSMAGIEIEGTAEYGDSVVCRVNGLPDEEAEPCTGMPAADAYWAFYMATDGAPWQYAQSGVSEQVLEEGDFVALSFQEGGESLPTVAADAQLRADAHAPASDANAADDPEAHETADEADDGGADLGLVIGIIVLLAVIGAAAVILARRRPSA
ncbi:hypothetical protein EHW97_07520 [Aeromicrobium camelliae]|uniref:DUF4430 domain-containing protein n=1 Tax=Aeromicrobium camelliae TaxID=1538144 RepID=A0A3N6X3C5_9ACTN|nr:hypothetical protein [Aeromicrobium camelliae]RQN08158.1 hypothetical protein EHW97_07520 [Aeromicrobium camelliae]